MATAWNLFTPWSSLAGGLLVGLAAALFVLGNGCIAGIVASPLRARLAGTAMAPERTRLPFIAGLLIALWLWRLFAPMPVATMDVGALGTVVAGLFVGVDVRMGNGCTSGLLFGVGLIAGGVTDPAKVKGFLDLFGACDPRLALVMGGAIAVGVFAFAAARGGLASAWLFVAAMLVGMVVHDRLYSPR